MPAIVVERRLGALADLSAEDIRATVAELNAKAERLGCVIFEGRPHQPGVAVIFAGNVERFFMLPVARHLTCRVIYFQDLQSGWFQGSDVLPDLQHVRDTLLVQEIGDKPCLFFGQSSGGYAALVASLGFPQSTVLSCAPQTFSDGTAKRQIGFFGVRCLSAPDGLIDLRQALQAHHDDAFRAVIIAASEAENPYTAHYWMDYLHALRLVGVPSVAVSIVRSNTHVIVHGRLNRFAELLGELQTVMAATKEDRAQVVIKFLEAEFA
ncbi:hypothetical protein P7D22_11220 [Lichenihabitans sp. Uapishka_5]|uniref:hypothetical protein n=1 Tax=Lichenihabitans sp. Uapishka_5 TaxID=3037302 RepID=UPI0029E82A21|nr:hypothetical protein [Lichenihabitans sp. Uapishka_5]MDX7951738.1 hypothetical protein [Lichenihabitans sp. Uapishka_5]